MEPGFAGEICAYAALKSSAILLPVKDGKPENDGGEDLAMWDRSNYLIRFVPGKHETDASYHLPHFYELFALWADEADRPFWKKAAEASRKFLHLACHPVTGLCPEKGGFDGSPAGEAGIIRMRTVSRRRWGSTACGSTRTPGSTVVRGVSRSSSVRMSRSRNIKYTKWTAP